MRPTDIKNTEVTRMKKTIIILGSVVSAAVVLGMIGLFAVNTALAQTPTP
jgi:nitrate/TMAO reductase-like tetraheme cytochrome c subunit